MGAYRFRLPPGWTAAAALPGGTGLLVVPPGSGAPTGVPPGGRGVAILVLHAVAASGTLAEELDRLVAACCRDLDVLVRGETAEYKTQELCGVLTWARVRDRRADAPSQEPEREFSHLYALLEADAERLPVVLLTGPFVDPAHRAAFQLVLTTAQRNPDPCDFPLSVWAD